MKIIKKITIIFFIIIVLLINACNAPIYTQEKKFSTKFTIEQHKERITKLYLNSFRSEIMNPFAEFYFFRTDIVYSFSNEPKFFLVEVQRFEYDNRLITMGLIDKDKYFRIGLLQINGVSCYERAGFLDQKKYFGSEVSSRSIYSKHDYLCAVEIHGEILGVCGENQNKIIEYDKYKKLGNYEYNSKRALFEDSDYNKLQMQSNGTLDNFNNMPNVLVVDTIEQYLEERGLIDRPYIIDDLYDKKGNQIYKLVEFEDDGYMIFDVSGSNPVLKDFSPNTASPYKKYEQENGEITSKKIYDPSDMLDREKNDCELSDYADESTGFEPHVLNYRSSWGYVTGRRIQVISSEGTTTPFFWPEEKNTLIVFREVE